MKRVLQISKYYFPFIGGIEQVALDISEALNGDCFEQKIICFNNESGPNDIIDNVGGVEVIRCGTNLKISSQAISFSYGKRLKEIMDEFKPDIVIFHYPNPFVAHFLLKYKKRAFKLYIYWHLDITKQKFLKILFKQQTLSLIKRANKILGATPKHILESEFSEKFKGKSYILPYAINEKKIKIEQDEIANSSLIRNKYNDKVLCFFVGRHVPYKGLQYLIESAKYTNMNLHFLIAGTGELTEELKKRAKNLSNVEFVGRLNDKELRSYLYACDIFCFPSITRNEAFGLALAEAMFYGKPAVTYTIKGSGVNYVNLNGVTGIECENKNVKDYAMALNTLSNDSGLRKKFGNNARERVLQNFTFDIFSANLLDFLTMENNR